MSVGDRIDSAIDKTKGKTNQAAGRMRGDEDQEMRGRGQETKGHLRDAKTDIKDAFKK